MTENNIVESRLNELRELCQKHPIDIPIPTAAKFMHVSPECLRVALEQGSAPFGFGWKRGKNRGFTIQTATFWQWFSGKAKF